MSPDDSERMAPFLIGMADDRVLSFPEFARIAGVSVVTLRRRITAGDGPIVTRLSARRIGIRIRHARAWLDSRSESTG